MLTCRILIVDNDPDDIDLLRSSLYEIGVKEVHGVHSMQKAIEFLQSITDPYNLPLLIITDLNMPRQNGHELLSHLKSTLRYSHIPVIILSTSGSAKETEKSISLGAQAYFIKPNSIKDYIILAEKLRAYITYPK